MKILPSCTFYELQQFNFLLKHSRWKHALLHIFNYFRQLLILFTAAKSFYRCLFLFRHLSFLPFPSGKSSDRVCKMILSAYQLSNAVSDSTLASFAHLSELNRFWFSPVFARLAPERCHFYTIVDGGVRAPLYPLLAVRSRALWVCSRVVGADCSLALISQSFVTVSHTSRSSDAACPD